MYERILVPLDCSETAEKAIPCARDLALCFASRVYLIHVVEPLVVVPVPSFTGPELNVREHPGDAETAQRYLDGWVQTLTGQGISASAILLHGNAEDRILDCIRNEQVSLVVMTALGRSGIVRLFGGSTAEAILARTTVPVLIVPLPRTR